jgi:hypothetical protein
MCGSDVDTGDLDEVHRLYLVPETRRVEEPEQWCVSCRSQYPNEQDA